MHLHIFCNHYKFCIHFENSKVHLRPMFFIYNEYPKDIIKIKIVTKISSCFSTNFFTFIKFSFIYFLFLPIYIIRTNCPSNSLCFFCRQCIRRITFFDWFSINIRHFSRINAIKYNT